VHNLFYISINSFLVTSAQIHKKTIFKTSIVNYNLLLVKKLQFIAFIISLARRNSKTSSRSPVFALSSSRAKKHMINWAAKRTKTCNTASLLCSSSKSQHCNTQFQTCTLHSYKKKKLGK